LRARRAAHIAFDAIAWSVDELARSYDRELIRRIEFPHLCGALCWKSA
jgi:hypothetical protein